MLLLHLLFLTCAHFGLIGGTIMQQTHHIFRGLMLANIVMHIISGILAGVWVADLVAPSGVMTLLNWLEVIMAVIAICVGLTYGTYLALRHLPTLPDGARRIATVAFIIVYSLFATVLALASASVFGAAAGERAHQEQSLNILKSAVETRRRAAASIHNRIPALTDCIDAARAMSQQEASTGAFSDDGGNVGRVAVTMSNISNGCATARDAIYLNRAALARHFDRAERLLIDARRVIDSELPRAQKMSALRKTADDLQRVLRSINDALAVEALQAAGDAMLKDWSAAGLPNSAANAITQHFASVADRLTEGLDEIAAIHEAALPGVALVSKVSYLWLYPDATIGALAIGLVVEMIPLSGILLGLTVLKGDQPSRAPIPNTSRLSVISRRPRDKRDAA
jgi:hypothetical protein